MNPASLGIAACLAIVAARGAESAPAQLPTTPNRLAAARAAAASPADGLAPGAGSPGEAAAPAVKAVDEAAVEAPARLLDRSPFDRITLTEVHGGESIETTLIDLPERKIPQPFPASGALKIYRLSEPSIAYEVDWSAIARIELYEEMLLAEAERLTAAGQFAEAFEYFAFLRDHYSTLAGLEGALEAHLWREASTTFAAGRAPDAWPVLQALYARNPQYPRLVNAVQAVSDSLIAARLQAGDYAAARAVVDALSTTFPDLPLDNVARWRERFRTDADAQMANARTALAAERYSEARAAVNYARAILPGVAGGDELWQQIQSAAPEIRVGVFQTADLTDDRSPPLWAATRIADLVAPRLVEMVDFGDEGGVYASRWAELGASDDGLLTTVELTPAAASQGIAAAALARQLAAMGAPGGARRHEDFAALVRTVGIADGRSVRIAWQRPHVRPEALLQVPLRWVTSAGPAAGLWFDALEPAADASERRYQRPAAAAAAGAPQYVVELSFANDEDALTALMAGDIDVLERVPPWQLERLRDAAGVAVTPYRLPTIHVLIPNYANPLLELREFWRALCYGIDAQSTVRDILLAGQDRPGFQPVSGPFPLGATLNDPVGYAYNTALPPRPYEPRLAALLSGLARSTLAKRLADAQKAAAKLPTAGAEATPAGQPALTPDAQPGTDMGEVDEAPPRPEPLVLAHPVDPLARVACQTIKLQLDQVGIPVELLEFQGLRPAQGVAYDLLYAELTPWEPVVDARRLLGSDGLAGRSGALMTAALDELARSENWNQAAARLKEVHRIAHYDLAMIPLWQTINFLAHRREVEGVGARPVSLYQNVSAWRKSLQ